MKKYIKPCTKWAELEGGVIMMSGSIQDPDAPTINNVGTDEAALGREVSSTSIWDNEW